MAARGTLYQIARHKLAIVREKQQSLSDSSNKLITQSEKSM